MVPPFIVWRHSRFGLLNFRRFVSSCRLAGCLTAWQPECIKASHSFMCVFIAYFFWLLLLFLRLLHIYASVCHCNSRKNGGKGCKGGIELCTILHLHAFRNGSQKMARRRRQMCVICMENRFSARRFPLSFLAFSRPVNAAEILYATQQ